MSLSNSPESDDLVLLAQLEELVRHLQSAAGFPQSSQRTVIRWLAKKDQESTRFKEASQAEQLEIARSAKDAAWEASDAAERAAITAERAAVAVERDATAAEAANRRAAIAIIITAISVAIVRIGVWIVHRDALHLPIVPRLSWSMPS